MSISNEDLYSLLRCPESHEGLVLDNDVLLGPGGERYPLIDGAPDLRRPPRSYSVDLPWYEPWDDLKTLEYAPPQPIVANDLPYHLDKFVAAIPPDTGNDRLILEIGCGERQCEAFFGKRGYRYVGMDVEARGIGPNVYGDAHNLPFKDESFEFLTSMAVFEHLVAPIVAAAEAYRVLKPGGVYFGTSAFNYHFHDHASFHHMSHGGLLSVFRTVGFEVQRMWAEWPYQRSVPVMAFGQGLHARPWYYMCKGAIASLHHTFSWADRLLRVVTGKPQKDGSYEALRRAGSIAFAIRKPG